jgi:hypothetical protein
MRQPIKLKELNCDELAFRCLITKKDVDVDLLSKTFGERLAKAKGLKRPPIFLAIDPMNRETDCHLHFTLAPTRKSDTLELCLSLHPLRKYSPPPSEDISLEHIEDWLGSAVSKKLQGEATASFTFADPPYKSVIPFPRNGVFPIESSLIRKSSITGIELTIEESDIGLKRVFLSKPESDKIYLVGMFRFTHDVSYSLFTSLADYAHEVASLFVLKEGQQ